MLSSGGDSEAARGVWPQTSGDSSRQPGQPRRSAARRLLMRPPPVTHELSVGVLTSGEMTESFSSFLGGVLASSSILGGEPAASALLSFFLIVSPVLFSSTFETASKVRLPALAERGEVFIVSGASRTGMRQDPGRTTGRRTNQLFSGRVGREHMRDRATVCRI